MKESVRLTSHCDHLLDFNVLLFVFKSAFEIDLHVCEILFLLFYYKMIKRRSSLFSSNISFVRIPWQLSSNEKTRLIITTII